MKKVLTIGKGLTYSIVASTNPTGSQFYLTDVDGWDEAPTLNRNTTTMLFGDGLIQSKNATWAGRDITIEIVSPINATNLYTIREQLSFFAQLPNSDYVLSLQYFVNGAEVRREEIRAKINTDGFIEWEQTDDVATITLEFQAGNPYKTVYLNGSSSPSSTTVI